MSWIGWWCVLPIAIPVMAALWFLKDLSKGRQPGSPPGVKPPQDS